MTIWHAHEMIFAYSMAVIAGFLLTAIKNWTGIQTINGVKLMLLVGLWLLGRVVPFLLNNGWVIAFIDVLFLPVLAISIALPLLQVNNKRNYFLIILIIIFATLNSLIHLELLGIISGVSTTVLKIALYLIIALVIVMAGRVFPMFSQNGVKQRYQVKSYSLIEKLAVPSYFAFILAVVFMDNKLIIIVASFVAGLIHAIRLKGWYNHQIWQVPLVWILHLGYLFLIVGFIMTALSTYYPSMYFLALHAFSIGFIGLVTIGMMARVSIGHTGRNLKFPPKTVKYSFILIILATLVRILLPLIVPTNYQLTVIISGLLWSMAFFLFVFSYTKILTSVRTDSRVD